MKRIENGITSPVVRAEGGICWACQRLLSASELPIRLDNDALLPVCKVCWESIPTGERISLGIQFKDRWNGDSPAWELLEQ